MKGKIRTESVCPLCHVRFAPILHPVTKDVIDLMCLVHQTRPVRGVYVDGRAFTTRRGTVGYLYRDERRRLFDSPMAAYRMLESIRHDWDRDPVGFDPEKWSQAGRRRHSLADVWDAWYKEIQRTRARQTRAHAELFGRLHVLPALGTIDVREMTRSDMTGLDAALQDKGLSPQTRLTAMNIVYTVLHYAIDEKLMTTDQVPPRPKIKVSKKKCRTLTPAQQAIIRAEMPKGTRLIVEMFHRAGMRIGEVCGVWRTDILPDGRVHVQRALDYWGNEGPPKNGERYTDPIPEDLYERLMALPVIDGPLFRNAHGRPYVTPVLSKVFRKAANKCGFPDVTLNQSGRHSLATLVAREAKEASFDAARRRLGNTAEVAGKHYVMEEG